MEKKLFLTVVRIPYVSFSLANKTSATKKLFQPIPEWLGLMKKEKQKQKKTQKNSVVKTGMTHKREDN